MLKRGQVTIFIIIGIVVLVGATLFFVFTGNDLESRGITVASVPSELLPVNTYVENCIRDTAIAGLKLVGDHGGYIDLEDKTLHGVSFSSGLDATSGDVVEMFDGYFVPYWRYMKSSNSLNDACVMSSKMPPLKKGESTSFVGPEASIESQLERYMDRSISCTGEFPGFTVTGGDVKTEVTVTTDSVRFFVKYPVKVVQEGSESLISEFLVEVPVNLAKIYELANEIVSAQQENEFLERNMISLLNIYSGVDSELIPPMHQIDLDVGPGEFWLKSDVREKVTGLLSSHMPLMQVQSADNFGVVPVGAATYAASSARLYDNMVLPISGFDGVDVRFNYFDWPIYFDMDSGELVRNKLSVGNEFVSFLGVKKYNNVYDISFPVAVELRDTSAFSFGNGFSLTFFLEGNIRNNEPYSCDSDLIRPTGYVVSNSLFCDQKNSGEVVVSVTDDGEPVSDVAISYKAGIDTCELGVTNANGELVTKFPIALGGVAKAVVPGYISESKVFSTQVDVPDELRFDLIGSKNVKLSVKKVQMRNKIEKDYKFDPFSLVVSSGEKTQVGFSPFSVSSVKDLIIDNPAAVDILADETAQAVFTRIGKPGQDEFSTVAEVSSSGTIVNLAPGTYSVSVNLFKNSELVIPEKESCALKVLNICTKKFKSPRLELGNPHIVGGLDVSEFTVSNQILDSDELVLKVLSAPEPKSYEDLDWLSEIEELSSSNRIYLLPEYK